MASYTPNLNLIKPADADSYDVANDNGNMDKIDAAYNLLNSNKSSLKVVSIIKENLSATQWGSHYYQDFDVASDIPSGYGLIAAMPMAGTGGSVLSVSVQGGTTIRLLNDVSFTGATLNISLICAKGLQ